MNVNLNIDKSYFNEKYLQYFNKTNRYMIFYGGAGSGKSHYISRKLIIDLILHKKKLLVIRQVYSDIADSVFAEFISALEDLKIIKFVTINKAPFKITFPNGSVILFKGADRESKLLSISGVDICWIEEASEISKELFNQLELRLRGGKHKKQFYLSFNPISENHWLKAEFFDNNVSDTSICHSTYLDNRFLDDDYIRTLNNMKIRNPQKYQVYALGHWGVLGDRVYNNWIVNNFNINEVLNSNKKLIKSVGLDFGFKADPAALVATVIDMENRRLYVYDELYVYGKKNNELAELIKAKGYEKSQIYADNQEQKSIAELKDLYGIKNIHATKKGKDSIKHGIQFLEQFEIIVHTSCENIQNEFESYVYPKDKITGKYKDKPVDANNHLMDALRYAVEKYSVNKKGKFKTYSKSILGL